MNEHHNNLLSQNVSLGSLNYNVPLVKNLRATKNWFWMSEVKKDFIPHKSPKNNDSRTESLHAFPTAKYQHSYWPIIIRLPKNLYIFLAGEGGGGSFIDIPILTLARSAVMLKTNKQDSTCFPCSHSELPFQAELV